MQFMFTLHRDAENNFTKIIEKADDLSPEHHCAIIEIPKYQAFLQHNVAFFIYAM